MNEWKNGITLYFNRLDSSNIEDNLCMIWLGICVRSRKRARFGKYKLIEVACDKATMLLTFLAHLTSVK